jgi:hypothetical protein
LINFSNTAPQANPFNMQPGTAAGGSAASTAGFDRQLSDALAQSLAKLGVTPGHVNISIGRAADSPSARQIVITWSDDAESTPAAPAAASPAGGDPRDEIPSGAGKKAASGAPDIQLNAAPAGNQYRYAGPAAFNPYFTTPSNPLREGYVEGFAGWYRDAAIQGGPGGPIPANRLYFATEEGAREALRLVREYVPEADLVQTSWGGGPYSATSDMYSVRLPGNRLLNAGLLLSAYYNGGSGVSVSSDQYLQSALQTA